MASKPTPSTDRNYRDAKTGQYVPPSREQRHPERTVSEPRPVPKKK